MSHNNCGRALGPWLHGLSVSTGVRPLVVLTPMDVFPTARPWLLGLTAVLQEVPLGIVGLGQPKVSGSTPQAEQERKVAKWRWIGTAIEHVVSALAHHRETNEQPLEPLFAVLDGFDTIISNSISGFTSSPAFARLTRGEIDMLAATECNSWPQCYRTQYCSARMRCAHACLGLTRHSPNGSPLRRRSAFGSQI